MKRALGVVLALASLFVVVASVTSCYSGYVARCDRYVGSRCYDYCSYYCSRWYGCRPVCTTRCTPVCATYASATVIASSSGDVASSSTQALAVGGDPPATCSDHAECAPGERCVGFDPTDERGSCAPTCSSGCESGTACHASGGAEVCLPIEPPRYALP